MERAQLCFGRVHHLRLRPARHGFGYGVYFLRLPLRAMSRQPASGRYFSWNRFNLLSFHEADHGDGRQPLVPWIDGLLRDAGIGDAEGEIWLQTFPRVLGYVFNPVSFWFCHRADGALRAILCEVNNTFGERHCYLLENGGELAWGERLEAAKTFHVSPFCQVQGHYRFRFARTVRLMDSTPWSLVEQVTAQIDYHDAKEAAAADVPLMHTSLAGTAYPLNDALALKAFFSYPLMSFGVVFRIHWQALRLWLKRVPFFSKPHPPASELTR
ncbi:DUF1365 domain-containing protein [Noviherbaspirillum galbum]|uniref:DUF1365 domain-containing protein n=1 Tax=Noviherbaspirillum galbum TaxID=2709383 RepID=A0A6B3SZN3_9BURK|nr:DUF1365 domain-containing protein [Noviherbaspirillum galbum]NEX64299.1 DUF1365 domain-containing protein [Noviherbaspirillum galbum]